AQLRDWSQSLHCFAEQSRPGPAERAEEKHRRRHEGFPCVLLEAHDCTLLAQRTNHEFRLRHTPGIRAKRCSMAAPVAGALTRFLLRYDRICLDLDQHLWRNQLADLDHGGCGTNVAKEFTVSLADLLPFRD